MVRRLDAEATALQRHGELGLWAPCQGQEAAQVGAARATRADRPDLPDVPRARDGLRARCRPGHAAGAVPRDHARRLGPGRPRVQPLHDRDRRPDPARRRLRAWASSATATDDAVRGLLRRRGVLPGRRGRGVRLRRGQRRAGGVLLPEQPVGDLRAAGAPDPDPAVQAGRRLRVPGRPGRRQRRAGR